MGFDRLKPWARVDPIEYRGPPLRAHEIFRDVPLHDVWQLDLPGGGDGRTVTDIRELGKTQKSGMPVKALFGVRSAVGKMFGWDRQTSKGKSLFQNRLSDEDRAKSEVEAGTPDGPFSVLYVFPSEAASEIKNKTVHAALVTALTKRGDGYRLLWAIYVKPVGPLTSVYMRIIDPFRRCIVYPSLLSRLHKSWCTTFAPGHVRSGDRRTFV